MSSHGYLLATRGVVLPDVPPARRAAAVQSSILELAERSGYTSVWAGNSTLAKPRLDLLTTLSATAVATELVRLGTAVYLPTLRHPAAVAHQTATVGLLSDGRFEFGVGTDDHIRDGYAQLYCPYGQRGRALDETLDIVTALWEGGSVDYDGQLFDLSGASIGFGPARSPPIHVASSAFDPENAHWRPPGRARDRMAPAVGITREIRSGAWSDPGTRRGGRRRSRPDRADVLLGRGRRRLRTRGTRGGTRVSR